MAKRRWTDLRPRTRRIIVVTGVIDGALRVAALKDLAGRSEEQVSGSRRRWRNGLLVVNSAGLLPIAYFLKGRRR